MEFLESKNQNSNQSFFDSDRTRNWSDEKCQSHKSILIELQIMLLTYVPSFWMQMSEFEKRKNDQK